ncbi:MAG TPA: hypothetical protein VGR10_02755, partial [Thermoleophilaceae bacterium]|nr:hypothetical protein [Thermoleophilaceae bacterium]
EFPSGDSPHENNYSEDGSRIFHASIGRVYTPADRCAPPDCLLRDTSKGDRRFQIVDADSLEILRKWNIGQKLDEYEAREDDPDCRKGAGATRPQALTART